MMNKEPQLGVALAKEICPVCLKEKDGPIIMNQKLTKDEKEKVEKIHGKTIGFKDKPCEECLEPIGDGVYLIEVDEDKTDDIKNPYRTGRHFGVTKEMVERVFQGVPTEQQVCYIPISVIKQIGLDEFSKK